MSKRTRAVAVGWGRPRPPHTKAEAYPTELGFGMRRGRMWTRRDLGAWDLTCSAYGEAETQPQPLAF